MSRLPDTTTPKPAGGAPARAAVLMQAVSLALLLALVLYAFLLPGGGDFAPGEEIHAPGVEDIAAGTGGEPFPRRDASRFGAGTEAVRVYLRVEDLPRGRRMMATVERSARSSAASRLFGETVRADGGGEERLSVFGGGVSGVVTFDVRAAGGLPDGGYAVEVRSVGPGGGEAVLARKYFVVGEPQA